MHFDDLIPTAGSKLTRLLIGSPNRLLPRSGLSYSSLLPKRAVNQTSNKYMITLRMIISAPTSGSTTKTVKRPKMNSIMTAARERRLFLTVGLSNGPAVVPH